MAGIVREIELKHDRQFRHTLVQARDKRHFKVYTFKLYDHAPPKEFAEIEVNVVECDESGEWNTLLQPIIKRFFEKQEALAYHEWLIDHLEEALSIPEPHKPVATAEGGH